MPPEREKYWVTKARRDRNNLETMVRVGEVDSWYTAKRAYNPMPGDKAFVWGGSPTSRIIALGTIVTRLTDSPDEDGDYRFSVLYETPFFLGPHQDSLRGESVLSTASFLKAGPSGTLYPLSYEQADHLLRLCRREIPALDWNETYETFADEVSTNVTQNLTEGGKRSVVVNAYERSRRARQICIDHFGVRCSVCTFDFSAFYGDIGADYIHVHHIVPLSETAGAYKVDPITDLRPVCPNCHEMLHRRSPPFSIEELKVRIDAMRRS